MYPLSFDATLYDIEITHDAWGITLSLDRRGESVRVLLDPDYVIEELAPPEALEFIAALVADRASVRVSKVPIVGMFVDLDVDLGSRHFSTRRRWGSGLASWEHRLLEP